MEMEGDHMAVEPECLRSRTRRKRSTFSKVTFKNIHDSETPINNS